MISFPNAKINLGLNIIRKRQDGYHDIESCLFPIPFHDVLEIIPSDTFSFRQTGLTIPDNGQNNLCIQAFELLKTNHDISSVAIHLHKVIPMGAGLGGGSSDCAFTLKLLNEIFSLRLTSNQLEAYAAQLGSDCPFFIKNIPAIATGRGTALTPFDLDLSDYHIAMIFPGVHIGTKEAYGGLTPKSPEFPLQETLRSVIHTWQGKLINDFQSAVAKEHPSVQNAIYKLESANPSYVAMTGSGSAVFGLFENQPDVEDFDFTGALRDL